MKVLVHHPPQPKALPLAMILLVVAAAYISVSHSIGFAFTALVGIVAVIVAGYLLFCLTSGQWAIFSQDAAALCGTGFKFRFGSAGDLADTTDAPGGRRNPVQVNVRDMSRQQIADNREQLGEVASVISAGLFQLNQRLNQEMQGRLAAEKEVQNLRLELEKRVTERTSQLQAANQELESFSFAVSHDLRSPLTSIIGFSNALLEDCGDSLSKDAHHYLERIIAASDRMKGKIEALLNFSRMNLTGLSVTDVDLSRLAWEIIQDLREAFPRENSEILIDEGLTTKADRVLLRTVLENLLGNAWKYTARKDKTVIRFGARHMNGESVYFISDNGAGFDMEHSDKLFEPFQRLHRIDEFEGNGIGLTTVKRIIRHHGGRVWGEAAVDRGATFYFTIGQAENYGTAPPHRQ
ncbi:ATP-binding protein [Geotalea sp. SG265]|uniref:sensor histidine kinase n=1 Tax=Geotalea sp. SG265 TaxID=2922867 RepID=UPI001FAEEE12|nr:ATP-binding protein [Geotalea sp. SG265]